MLHPLCIMNLGFYMDNRPCVVMLYTSLAIGGKANTEVLVVPKNIVSVIRFFPVHTGVPTKPRKWSPAPLPTSSRDESGRDQRRCTRMAESVAVTQRSPVFPGPPGQGVAGSFARPGRSHKHKVCHGLSLNLFDMWLIVVIAAKVHSNVISRTSGLIKPVDISGSQ